MYARSKRILVIGDVMVDRVFSGSVDRICPEAPVPVLSVAEEHAYLGGAANVANNLAPYVDDVVVIGVVGDDASGQEMASLIEATGCRSRLVIDRSRPTTTKTRMVSIHQQLLRCDRESRAPIEGEAAAQLIEIVSEELTDAALVLVSDYAKGCLPTSMFQTIARLCKETGVRLLVDPKKPDLTDYRGAWLIKPNRPETQVSAGFEIKSPDDAMKAGQHFIETTEAAVILITLGSQGMMIVEKGESIRHFHIPTDAREVFDVTGAGDTTLAFLALGLVGGLPIEASAALANIAAGITISKRGTARVEPFELETTIALRERRNTLGHKVVARTDVASLGESLRRRNRRIVFTNGCFDILHPGHAELLRNARALGDALVVGINSDASVTRIKGPARPFFNEADRMAILCSLECVDSVIVFGEDTPEKLLEELCPDVLAKGANYSEEEVVGAEIVRANGGEVIVIPIASDHSVTELGRRIHNQISAECGLTAVVEPPTPKPTRSPSS